MFTSALGPEQKGLYSAWDKIIFTASITGFDELLFSYFKC